MRLTLERLWLGRRRLLLRLLLVVRMMVVVADVLLVLVDRRLLELQLLQLRLRLGQQLLLVLLMVLLLLLLLLVLLLLLLLWDGHLLDARMLQVVVQGHQVVGTAGCAGGYGHGDGHYIARIDHNAAANCALEQLDCGARSNGGTMHGCCRRRCCSNGARTGGQLGSRFGVIDELVEVLQVVWTEH